MSKETIIGIDLGTTNSVVSYMQEDGTVKVIPNPEGHNTTPSVVSFKSDGEEIVGDAAKRQMVTNPDTVYSIKRHMGETYKVHINCINKDFTPQEISAKILAYMKKYAEDNLGHEVKKAIITCPAYFNDAQRQATKDAGTIAGLDVIRVISEPTASALAYGIKTDKPQKIMVFDLGGGTLDVSILDISDGVFEVIATSGDTHLGGDDWDAAISKWLVEQIKKQSGLDVSDNKMTMQRLKDESEKAKITLSSSVEASIILPYIGVTSNGPVNFETTLTRAKFQDMTKDLLNRCKDPVRKALADSKLEMKDLSTILLIGGSTRMPAVVDLVANLIGQKPNQSVNPDEAVSIGASIQGGVVSGEKKDILLLDVTPLTLGIETLGGVMTPLIPRNTTIPTDKTQIFSTAEDNQPAVDVVVYQGERPMAADNKMIGHFKLDGIKPARRGEPRIEVTFSIDVNGIVTVKAKDLDTQKEQHITISNSTGLSKSEIDRMIHEAEENKEADEKHKADIEIRNKAEQYINQIDQLLPNINNENEKTELNKLKDNLKDSLDKNDISSLKDQLKTIDDMMIKAQQQADANQTASETSTSNNDTQTDNKNGPHVYDADYTEKKK